jgi:acyl carrier protein
MKAEFKEFVILFKEQYLDEVGDIDMDNKFRELPGWDSMTGMTILLMIEENYNVKIENEQFKKLKTIGDIFNFINNKE